MRSSDLIGVMKVVYNNPNNQDKVKTRQFYHIICDPDLDEGFCAMLHIPCACTGCVEQLSSPWLTNLDKTLQPHYDIKPKTCKYSYILRGCNKWYISKFTFVKETTNPDKMEIKDKLVLNGMTWEAADNI